MLDPPKALQTLLEHPRCGLGVFLPAGLDAPATESRCIADIAHAGADLFEIGLPHHTPFLDGPVVRAAYEHALREGAAFDRTLRAVEYAAGHAPTVVMTYWDPVTRHGPEHVARCFASAGAAGVMVVDLPDDAADTWLEVTDAVGLAAPRLAPRATSAGQLDAISASASGWLYAPASDTPTGYRGPLDLTALATAVRRLHSASPLPIVSGVGISTPRLAADVAPLVDAIVIGSPVVRALQRGSEESSELVAAFAEALRPAPDR